MPKLGQYMVLAENNNGEPRAVSIFGEWKGWSWRPIDGKWVSWQRVTQKELDLAIEIGKTMNPCPICEEIKLPWQNVCENPDCSGWTPRKVSTLAERRAALIAKIEEMDADELAKLEGVGK